MDIIVALTLGVRLADLAVDAMKGISTAIDAYGKVRPLIDTLRADNRPPTPEEWVTINRLFDDSFNRLMED